MLGDPVATINMLDALLRLPEPSRRGMYVHVRLDDVVSIDAPSLLLFCSRLRWLNDHKHSQNRGSYPRHKKAIKALRDGGFESFLQGRLPIRELGPPTLALIQGTKWNDLRVQPEVPARVQRFLEIRNPEYTEEQRFYIFLALMECLENVRQHAYKGIDRTNRDVEFDRRGWYVVGLYDEDERRTTLAILDQGIGVVQSTSQNLSLRSAVRDWFSRSPSDILELAASGLRTETGEPKRGRGLKRMRDFAQAAPGRRFHLISSSAMVTWSDTQVQKRSIPELRGTIVCLEMDSPRGDRQ